MLKLPRAFTRAAAAVATLALAACGESGPGTTQLSIRLTDAPGDFKAAVVTISEVALVGQGGELVLRDQPVTTNLLTLVNDAATLVQDATVPSGSYQQLRFKISGGYIEVENADGSTSIYASSPNYAGLPAGATVAGSLQLPSFAQTGIKVNFEGDRVEVSGDQKVFLVDFDVSQSFGRQAGNSGQWVMSPVIRGGDIRFTGSLKVSATNAQGVTFDLATATAILTEENGDPVGLPVPLVASSTPGTFEATFVYRAPGTYRVALGAPAGTTLTTNPAAPATVNVASGQQASVAFTVTAAQTAQ